MSGVIVRVRDAGYRYPGGVEAVRGATLDVAAGEVVGVAGANGAGKSTLARLLNGLLRPTAGSVLVDGADTRRTSVSELARTVGLVFGDPRSQLFARTVADELAFGPRNLGVPPGEVAARVAALAERLGLDGELARSPLELPGPRRRLVAIASVLTMHPRVVVLDEPTTGQDARVKTAIAGLVRSLAADGVAVVCVSHDMPLLAGVASRVVVMAGGAIVRDGPARDVFADDALLLAAGLLAPQVTRLAASLPTLAGRPAVLTVGELVPLLAGPAATPWTGPSSTRGEGPSSGPGERA